MRENRERGEREIREIRRRGNAKPFPLASNAQMDARIAQGDGQHRQESGEQRELKKFGRSHEVHDSGRASVWEFP